MHFEVELAYKCPERRLIFSLTDNQELYVRMNLSDLREGAHDV